MKIVHNYYYDSEERLVLSDANGRYVVRSYNDHGNNIKTCEFDKETDKLITDIETSYDDKNRYTHCKITEENGNVTDMNYTYNDDSECEHVVFEEYTNGELTLKQIYDNKDNSRYCWSKYKDEISESSDIYKYDEKGRVTFHSITVDGDLRSERHYEYDDDSNTMIIETIRPNIISSKGIYVYKDKEHNKLLSRNISYSDGTISDATIEYDEKDRIVHFKSTNEEQWYEYDDEKHTQYYRDSFDNSSTTEYDEKGNIIHLVENGNNIVDEEWDEYDENGKLISCHTNGGNKTEFYYNEHGNITKTIYYEDDD